MKKERPRKIKLSNVELLDLLEINAYNKSAVARRLNVSETAIRKRMKNIHVTQS